MGADNQQERLPSKAQKWFVAGLIEGEASFHVGIKRHPTAPYGYFIDPAFFCYQHKCRRRLLEMVRETLGAGGAIRPKQGNEDVLILQVSSRKKIAEKLIPFFDKYYLPFSSRRKDYLAFKRITLMLLKGVHRNPQGLAKIVKIAHSTNREGRYRRIPLKAVLDRILRGHTSNSN